MADIQDSLLVFQGVDITHGDSTTIWNAARKYISIIPENVPFNMSTPRCWSNSLIANGGWLATSGPCNLIEAYDMRQKVWYNLNLSDPLGARCYLSLAVVPPEKPKWVYFIGGTRQNHHRSEVNRLDLSSLSFSTVSSMNERRCFVSTAVLKNGDILAVGGHNGTFRLKSAERYDPVRNQWEFVASMSEVRSDAGAAKHKSKVYVAGGFNGEVILSSVECYNPKIDSWTSMPNMTTRRSGHEMVAGAGSLFCLGGFDGSARLSSCERFSFQTKRWDKIASMKSPRSNFASAVIGNTIIVCGGFLEPSPVSSVECYDILNDCWTNLDSMNHPRSALSMAFLPGISITNPEFGPPALPEIPRVVIQDECI